MLRYSRPFSDRTLFMPQRLDRVELGGFVGGVEAEEDAHGAAAEKASRMMLGHHLGAHVAERDRTGRTRRPRRCTPSSPPTRLSISASERNCKRMSLGVAPTAWRMPISRVRSVTLTSMMFMMPMPPTISETPATQASRLRKVSVVDSWVVDHIFLGGHGEVGLVHADLVAAWRAAG